ncbi:MAG: carboxypeptidase regulatory-like domain-containing protein [Chitinispirillaceae bacterium]|nr:carboxypeptidase regulatory-like domain-containing protein [Chitinispirillaceae bacterium]
MRLHQVIVLLLLVVYPCVSQEIAVKGTIKDGNGNAVENALIRFENLGYVTVSSAGGGFELTSSSPVQPRQITHQTFDNLRIDRGALYFSVGGKELVVFSIYNLHGQLCAKKRIDALSAGSYSVDLEGLIPSPLGSGTYIVSSMIGTRKVSGKVAHRSGDRSAFVLRRMEGALTSPRLARQLSSVDTVTISKLGYVSKSLSVENYQQDLGVIILEKSSVLEGADAIAAVEDSLVNLFVERIQSIENLEGPDELKSIDFISLRNGFEAILEINDTRIKSNIGYMLSALASLNTNPKIWKIADSLDAYFDALDEDLESGSASSEGPLLMKRAMKRGGIATLGKALAAKTPELLLAAAQKPSFPKFLTIGYIQNLIESDLIPVIGPILEAAERIEALGDASMLVTVDGDEYEIDKGEIYLFDAYMNLMQASMYMLCVYDMDLFTAPDRQDYSWIDSLVNNDGGSKRMYTLSGDTLYEISSWQGEKEEILTMVSLLHYNIEQRGSFMTIRRPYHSAAFNSLKAIPAKIKAGLAAIKAETDDQENDLMKLSDVNSAEGDMLDFSGDLRDEGFSASFAENFSSIDKLMDFITSLLNGPYTFNETIDGTHITATVDLPAWFNDPVTDLRTLLPKYVWTNEAEWVKADTFSWSSSSYNRRVVYNAAAGSYDTLYYIYVYDEEGVEMKINPSLIDSIGTTEWGETIYYIGTPIRYRVSIDSSYYFDALRLTDETGAVMGNETIDELVENRMFFPYFDDYTFHGLFPGMTRGKWLDLIWADE